MKKNILFGLILIFILLVIVCTGCTTKSSQNIQTGAISTDKQRYFEGDILSGNMTLAGYDTPDNNISRYKVVILAYQPDTGMYIYSFVEPIQNGTYKYVLSDNWESRLARERKEFENFGLEKTGNMPKMSLWNVT